MILRFIIFFETRTSVTCNIYFTYIDVSKFWQKRYNCNVSWIINGDVTTSGKTVDNDGIIQRLFYVVLINSVPAFQSVVSETCTENPANVSPSVRKFRDWYSSVKKYCYKKQTKIFFPIHLHLQITLNPPPPTPRKKITAFWVLFVYISEGTTCTCVFRFKVCLHSMKMRCMFVCSGI